MNKDKRRYSLKAWQRRVDYAWKWRNSKKGKEYMRRYRERLSTVSQKGS